jgi:hypothetical protein
MHTELIAPLTKALSEAEAILSRSTSRWVLDRRDSFTMLKFVINTAPEPIIIIAAHKISHLCHPKSEVLNGPLKGEIGALASGLISENLYRSNEADIIHYVEERAKREDIVATESTPE